MRSAPFAAALTVGLALAGLAQTPSGESENGTLQEMNAKRARAKEPSGEKPTGDSFSFNGTECDHGVCVQDSHERNETSAMINTDGKVQELPLIAPSPAENPAPHPAPGSQTGLLVDPEVMAKRIANSDALLRKPLLLNAVDKNAPGTTQGTGGDLLQTFIPNDVLMGKVAFLNTAYFSGTPEAKARSHQAYLEGVAAHLRGDRSGAQTSFLRATTLDPDNKDAKDAALAASALSHGAGSAAHAAVLFNPEDKAKTLALEKASVAGQILGAWKETASDANGKENPKGPAIDFTEYGYTEPQIKNRTASEAQIREQDSDQGEIAESYARGRTGVLRQTGLRVAGDNFMRAGKPERAEPDYAGALQVNPRDERAKTGHALALAQQGKTDEASKEASAIAAADPRNPVAAMVAGHAEQLDRSGGVVKKVSNLVSGLWSGRTSEKFQDYQASGVPSRGAILRTENSNVSAAQTAAPGKASPPAEPSVAMTPILPVSSMAHYKEAFGKLQVRDMTGALLEATASINDAPSAAAPWVLRAYIDNRLTPEPNPKGAVSDAGQALQIEPQNAAALREKALAEITQGQFAPAMSDLASAISLDPKNGTGYLYRAMAQEKLGRASDAVADYNKAASLDPALTPFANQAVERLGGAKFADRSSSSGPSSRNRKLVRGGMIALALVLILAGMLSTEAGRKLITQRAIFTTKGAKFDRTLAPSRALSTGEVIGGNYRIERELGRGGMGIVYEAMDLALQRPVAVKQLQRTEAATAEDLERFLREARLVAKLRNPRLVEIYNVINEGDLFLVFEYMDGKSLDQVMTSRLRLSLPEVHQALADIGAAIDYAHGQNVIHRDLKPANVMVEKNGRCKVMDFGIAHQSQAATRMTQTVASGTPPYMAPEQAFGSVSKASDLYAMGVMAYELATGRRPFAGPDYVEQKLRREFASVTRHELPASLDAFFQKALDPDPTKRYVSAAELLQGFRQACAAQPV